jgi:hypothetical protein
MPQIKQLYFNTLHEKHQNIAYAIVTASVRL